MSRRSRPWASAGGLLVLLVLLAAVLAPLLSPHSPTLQDLARSQQPPAWLPGGSWENPLGTDHLGRDVLSRILYGTRVSLVVGVGGVALALALGLLIGLLAGYARGWVDDAAMRLCDVQLALLPLDEAATTELLRSVLGEDPRLSEAIDFLRGRAGGNPFFVEQLVRSLVDAGALRGKRGAYTVASSVQDVALPPTVKALLSSRIDRLPEDQKEVLHVAAVIGKRFTEPVLARVTGFPPDDLSDALRGLRVAPDARLADADQAGVGGDADEVPAIDQEVLDRLDLHGRLLHLRRPDRGSSLGRRRAVGWGQSTPSRRSCRPPARR